MCNSDKKFVELSTLKQPLEVTLGDGHPLEATGCDIVTLKMKLPQGKSIKCKLHDVLYVPKLSYNLLSVSKVTESGKAVKFSDASSEILDEKQKLIATATRVGCLYYLNCQITEWPTSLFN